MPKGKSDGEILRRGCEAYDAINDKIDNLWEEYQDDFSQYPSPSDLIVEFDSMLQKHGKNYKDKARSLYTRLVNEKFTSNG
jgi:hypothetical protein